MSTIPQSDELHAAADQVPSLQGVAVTVIGAGAIATGVAAAAAIVDAQVTVAVRSDAAAARAGAALGRIAERTPRRFRVPRIHVGEPDVAAARVVIEAISEDLAAKASLLSMLGAKLDPRAVLASTTSSLSITDLAQASGVADRFFGLHVFNPVPRMELVELVFAPATSLSTRRTAFELCIAIGKQPVEAPDTPGFIVNRLLFPYLFSAVRLLEETGLAPAAIDTAMTLGAAHPMGPFTLLDFIGLDVASAIGESLGLSVPATIQTRIGEGRLGRKTGAGLLD